MSWTPPALAADFLALRLNSSASIVVSSLRTSSPRPVTFDDDGHRGALVLALDQSERHFARGDAAEVVGLESQLLPGAGKLALDLPPHVLDEGLHGLVLGELAELRLVPVLDERVDVGDRGEAAGVGAHELLARHGGRGCGGEQEGQ